MNRAADQLKGDDPKFDPGEPIPTIFLVNNNPQAIIDAAAHFTQAYMAMSSRRHRIVESVLLPPKPTTPVAAYEEV
jgi:hypothetical protein